MMASITIHAANIDQEYICDASGNGKPNQARALRDCFKTSEPRQVN